MKTIFDSIYEGSLEEIKSLVALGYDLNKSFDDTDEGKTPLMTSLELDNSDVFNLLLELGADISQTTPKRADNALSWASKYSTLINFKALISALEEKGLLDINYQNKQGNTPLMLSALIGHTEIFKEILKYNPDMRIKNKAGQTVYEVSSHDFGHERMDIRRILSKEITTQAIRKMKL